MSQPLTPEKKNLLFHSYFTVSLLAELTNPKHMLIGSSYFEGMEFGAPWIKKELRKIGVGNVGCAMMMLYAMLVVPREVDILNAYPTSKKKIDEFLKANLRPTSTYSTDGPDGPDYIRHIRNAVAHVQVDFGPNGTIIFNDAWYNKKAKQQEKFSAGMPLPQLGPLAQLLQGTFLRYIEDLQQQTG